MTESHAGQAIRPATRADSDALLAWRNDPEDFQWYLDSTSVRSAEHEAWLDERLNRARPSLWVVTLDGTPAGSVRLDAGSPSLAVVSIVVDPVWRGRGLGRSMLAFLDGEARAQGFERIEAVIHPDNSASHALFAAAGYRAGGRNADGFDVRVRGLTAPGS